MDIYQKINKFLILIKYADWSVDQLWSQRRRSFTSMPRLMLVRAEMGHFLRGLTQHCIKNVVYNQAFKFRTAVAELSKR